MFIVSCLLNVFVPLPLGKLEIKQGSQQLSISLCDVTSVHYRLDMDNMATAINQRLKQVSSHTIMKVYVY